MAARHSPREDLCPHEQKLENGRLKKSKKSKKKERRKKEKEKPVAGKRVSEKFILCRSFTH